MKKIVKALSVIIAPLMFVCAFLTGCKKGKEVDENLGDIMRDIDVKPTQTAAYEKYSKQALDDYYAVANKYLVDGEVDRDDPEVIKAASQAAAKLYAYACYNERDLDHYAYFNNQSGETTISGGSANVFKQDFYVRINESDSRDGYRYQRTNKYVDSATGVMKTFKGMFEGATLRITEKTNVMYRFEGDKLRFGAHNDDLGCDIIECDWKTKTDEWGVFEDEPWHMHRRDFIPPEDMEADIQKRAGDFDIWVHGNINILAENVVKHAIIMEEEETDGYLIIMNVDSEIANGDEASIKMLTLANKPFGDCHWTGVADDPDDTGLRIIFRIWNNGLFRWYSIIERWAGSAFGFGGTAESTLSVNYSYSERDCDPAKSFEMLANAKKLMGE